MGLESRLNGINALHLFSGFTSPATEIDADRALLHELFPKSTEDLLEGNKIALIIERIAPHIFPERFGLAPDDLNRPVALRYKDLDVPTFGTIIWRELEEPGTLTACHEQNTDLSTAEQIALFKADWYSIERADNIVVQIGQRSYNSRERLTLGSDPYTQAGKEYRRSVLELLQYRIKRIRETVSKFLERWNEQMTGTPYDVLSSFPETSELVEAIFLSKNGEPKIAADLILDAALDRSALVVAERRITQLTQQQQTQLVLLRNQSLPPTIRTDLSTVPISESGQRLVQAEMMYLRGSLVEIKSHLQRWQRVPGDQQDLTSLEPMPER